MTYPILITGASRGLGASMALNFAKNHHIVAVARTTGGLEELDDRIQAIGGKSTLVPLDLTDPDAVAYLCRSIHERWGGVLVWVHCAVHAAPLAPANFIDRKDWAKSVDLNVNATRILISMISPLLGQQGTALFFDDSTAGQKFLGSYGSTKAAQIALVKSWQAETKNTGPNIQILKPAPMPTSTRARFYPGEDRALLSSCDIEAERLISQIHKT